MLHACYKVFHVFFQRIKADCYRYFADVAPGDARVKAARVRVAIARAHSPARHFIMKVWFTKGNAALESMRIVMPA